MSEPNPNPPVSVPAPSLEEDEFENELRPYDEIVRDHIDDSDDNDRKKEKEKSDDGDSDSDLGDYDDSDPDFDDDDSDEDEDEDDDDSDSDSDKEELISLGSQDTDPNRPGTGSRPSRSRKRARLDDSEDVHIPAPASASAPVPQTKKKEFFFTHMTAFIEKADMNGNKMWMMIRGRVDNQQFECRGTTAIVGSQFKFILPWIVYSVSVNEQPVVKKGQNGTLKPVFDNIETQLNVLAVIAFDRPELSRSYVLEIVKKYSPEIMRDPHVADVYRSQKTACDMQKFEKRADFAFMGANALSRFAHELLGNLLRVPAYYYLYYALGQEYLDSKTDREISDIWSALQHMDSRRDMFFTLTTLGYIDITSPAMIAIKDLFAESITDHERMLVRLWKTHIREPWTVERRIKWTYSPEMQPLEREGLISQTVNGGSVPRSLYTLMRGSILTKDADSVVNRWIYVVCSNVSMARKLIVNYYNERGREMPGNTDTCVMDARNHQEMTPEPRKKVIIVWRAHELLPSDFLTLARVLHTSPADIFLCGQPFSMHSDPPATGEPKTDAERRRLDAKIMNWYGHAFARAPVIQKIMSLDSDFFAAKINTKPPQMSAGEMISRVESVIRKKDGTLILCRNDNINKWLRTQIDSRLGAVAANRVSQGDWIIGVSGEQQRVHIIWKAAGGTMYTEVPSLRVEPFPNEYVVAYNRTARDDARIPWGVSPKMKKYLIAPLEGNGFTPVSGTVSSSEDKRILYVTNSHTLEPWELSLLDALVPSTSSLSLTVEVLMYRDTERGSELPPQIFNEEYKLADALDVELASVVDTN